MLQDLRRQTSLRNVYHNKHININYDARQDRCNKNKCEIIIIYLQNIIDPSTLEEVFIPYR